MTGFQARFDQGDGTDLRHVDYGGEEIAARIYPAVRDDRWRTVPLEVAARDLEHDERGFHLRVTGRTRWESHPLDFAVDFRAEGGRLVCTFEGLAGADFRFNRIGFCVLLPLGFAGSPVELRTASGRGSGDLPAEITPQLYRGDEIVPMFETSFTGLVTTLPTGTRVDIAFTGDEFEVEDQRNWSDASYKIYGTPLALGFPFDAVAGQRFAQAVEIELTPGAAAPDAPAAEIVVGERVGALPRVGLYEPGEPRGVWRPEMSFPDLNRTRPDVATLGAVAAVSLGINGSVHADDRWSIAESASTHGMIAAQVRALYPDLELRLRPLDFATPAGNWMRPDGRYTHTPAAGSDHPLRREPFAATWVITSLGSLAGVAVASVDVFEQSLAGAPVGRLVAELSALAGATVRRVAAPAGVGALAVDDGDTVLLFLANPDTRPRTVDVRGVGPVRLAPDEIARIRVPREESA